MKRLKDERIKEFEALKNIPSKDSDEWNEFIESVYSGIDYLGWIHFPNHRILRTKTKRRAVKNCHKKDVEKETIQSYLGLLKHGNCYKITLSSPISRSSS